jgi:hypothetical protein
MSRLTRRPNGLDAAHGCSKTATMRNSNRIGLCAAICVTIATWAAGTVIAVKAAEPGAGEIIVGLVLDIESVETSFNLGVAGPVPPRSYILIQKLPASVALSEGDNIAPGTWAVSLSALESLRVRVPAGFVGSYDFSITLFDGAGSVLDERIIYLHAKSPIAAGPSQQEADVTPPKQTASIPPATDAPAAAEKASPTPDQLAQAERLLRQGKSFLDQGNITIARQYFARAADLGLPMAALRMAETYDPHELERANVHGPRPNISVARQWYQRAAQLGIPEAEARLRRLSGQ